MSAQEAGSATDTKVEPAQVHEKKTSQFLHFKCGVIVPISRLTAVYQSKPTQTETVSPPWWCFWRGDKTVQTFRHCVTLKTIERSTDVCYDTPQEAQQVLNEVAEVLGNDVVTVPKSPTNWSWTN
jgi:hypothetical protein